MFWRNSTALPPRWRLPSPSCSCERITRCMRASAAIATLQRRRGALGTRAAQHMQWRCARWGPTLQFISVGGRGRHCGGPGAEGQAQRVRTRAERRAGWGGRRRRRGPSRSQQWRGSESACGRVPRGLFFYSSESGVMRMLHTRHDPGRPRATHAGASCACPSTHPRARTLRLASRRPRREGAVSPAQPALPSRETARTAPRPPLEPANEHAIGRQRGR